MNEITPTARSRVKRHHERAAYDLRTIAAILDATFLCHVGYVIDGQAYVTPTSYWRENDVLYWHGSSASRMLRTLEQGIDCCFTVTVVDGLVLARCAFNHSINYRSVMLFGRAAPVADPAEKQRQLERFTERMYPGRWPELRPVTPREIKATTVLSMHIEEDRRKYAAARPRTMRRITIGQSGRVSFRCRPWHSAHKPISSRLQARSRLICMTCRISACNPAARDSANPPTTAHNRSSSVYVTA
jgi:nitroimidazol reductase NimA-like FMN-containing flavoprotein (pyridoxamine 5'-phosphate oxidase superfamily)